MSAALQQKPHPPYPSESHWLFGSGYLLRDNTLANIKFLVEKYGDIVSLKVPFHKLVIAANPDYARYILVDNNKNYHKSIAYDVLKLLLGNGLLTSEGDFWRKQRRLIQPAFHKQKLAAITAMMVRESEQLVKRFSAFQNGEYVDMLPEMTSITLDIIARAMFSTGVEDKAAEVGKGILILNEYAVERLNDPFKLPPSFPTLFNYRWNKQIAFLNSLLIEIINQRRKEDFQKDDLLSMLMNIRDEETGEAMDDQQLLDEVKTIFVAGNETSANALTWTLYLLSQNPDAEEKMIKEIDEKLNAGTVLTFENIMQFQYVRMVIDESLRLFPPAWAVGRRNYQPDELGNYRIDAETNVIVPIIYIHRNEKYWNEPDKFIPERFTPEKRNQIDRFVYFPFGGGPRLCIGNNFALIEMQIILILLYRSFKFRLQPGFEATPDPLITLKPENGMMMKVEKRN